MVYLCRLLLTSGCVCLLAVAIFVTWNQYSCSVARSALPPNASLLRETLAKDLFGQSLAVETLVGQIDDFFSAPSSQSSNNRVRVLALVGGSGTGKSLAMTKMAETFANSGFPASNVHRLSATLALDESGSDQETFDNFLATAARGCGHQILLLDDYTQSEPGKWLSSKMQRLIDELGSDSNESDLNGVAGTAKTVTRRNQTLVVISTLDYAEHINSRSVDLWKRHQATLPKMDMETYQGIARELEIQMGISGSAAVGVVPFLPLGRDTVRRCVEKSLATNHNLILSKVRILQFLHVLSQ